MLIIGIMPPSGVKLSCMLLTAPHDVSVVTVAHSAELATPKRTSFPSMLPPAGSTPIRAKAGLPAASDQ